MFKTTEGAADCEIRYAIRFLNARNVLPSEIHHQICQVYGDNAMSDGMVRKWVRMFNEGQQNVHDGLRLPCECGGGRVSNHGRLETRPPPHSYGNRRLPLQFEISPDDGHISARNMLSGVYVTK
jgi:hypothetical protein